MTTRSQSSSLTGAGLLIAATVVASALLGNVDTKVNLSLRQQASSSPQVDRSITLTDYERVRLGLSAAQVGFLLGRTGREVSRIETSGVPTTVLYSWHNPDGSNVNITFHNGAVTMKSQFGLQ